MSSRSLDSKAAISYIFPRAQLWHQHAIIGDKEIASAECDDPLLRSEQKLPLPASI